jgi:ribosomal protein S18 acetylase RimI-like enzyme
MTSGWVRPATPDDAQELVAIIRDVLSPEERRVTIFGCPGIERFVAESAKLGLRATPTFVVAGRDDRTLGAAVFSSSGPNLFLSYIGVRQSDRSQGFGRLLLRFGASLMNGDGSHLVLDVMQNNSRAFRWYQSLGLSEIGRRSWWELDGRSETDGAAKVPGHVSFRGLPQADACHRVFGFSEFAVQTGGDQWTVGRLDSALFRLTDPAGLANEALLSTLSALDPTRNVLCLGDPSDPAAPTPHAAREILRARRMTAPVHAMALM